MGTRAGLDYPEGDPGGLSAAGSRLSSLAAAVAADAGSVARAGNVAGWQGKSSRLFAAATGQLARPLAAGANALHRAGRAVDDLADLIRQAQSRIRAWAEEIEEAERQVDAARTALHAATLPADPFAGPAWDPGRQRDAQARYDRAAGRVADLRARYQPKARQLCVEIERADRSTQGAVLAAADAAPAGGAGVPGAPKAPADVRTFAPVWMFAPGESFLPADPHRSRFRDITDFDSYEQWLRYLRGQGAGAPIFYRVRPGADKHEKIIEYWFYRRWNDFRDLGIRGVTNHPDDTEGIAIRIRNGRPVQVGYSQHEHGCSLPFSDAPKRGGHPVLVLRVTQRVELARSGARRPRPGTFDDVHGPRPGEGTPRDHVVHGEDNPRRFRDSGDWRLQNPHDRLTPDNDDNGKKFASESEVWVEECEPLPGPRLKGTPRCSSPTIPGRPDPPVVPCRALVPGWSTPQLWRTSARVPVVTRHRAPTAGSAHWPGTGGPGSPRTAGRWRRLPTSPT